jgi:hypothetical protein
MTVVLPARCMGKSAAARAHLLLRLAELDNLRIARGLSHEERDEADRLTHRLYMIEWRKGPSYQLSRRRMRANQGARHHGA